MRSDGTFRTGEYLRYICYHKSRKLCQCDGQSTYIAKKVDEILCSAIMDMFNRVRDMDEIFLQKKYNKRIDSCKAMETKLNMELEKYAVQLDTMNAEIADSLTGNSVYSPEQLASAITSINQKFDEAKLQLETVRNEKLANIFYLLSLIESFGTGIQKILRCYKNNAIKPEIIVSDNAFKIILPNINYRSETSEATGSYEDMVMKLLSEQETVTRKETETLLDVSQATAARVLKKMAESGSIMAVGSGKNLKYKKK